MTTRAANDTTLYLALHAFKAAPPSNHVRNLVFFSRPIDMIEVQHDRVCLATVDAWMSCEKVDHVAAISASIASARL